MPVLKEEPPREKISSLEIFEELGDVQMIQLQQGVHLIRDLRQLRSTNYTNSQGTAWSSSKPDGFLMTLIALISLLILCVIRKTCPKPPWPKGCASV